MYDVIIVGARCAGSPTAMLLARKGYRVLMLDRATFPSDALSTHFVQPNGVALLREWGLLDEVIAAGTPEISALSVIVNGLRMPFPPPEGPSYCPRRYILDDILVRAAIEAGADFRGGFRVDDVLIEAGVVVGIRGHSRDGEPVEERARFVVGADGHRSMVAEAVGAERYHEQPPLTGGYYSYFSGIELEGGAEIHISGRGGVLAFATNGGLACIAAGSSIDRFAAYRADIEDGFQNIIDGDPEFARRVKAGRREEKWRGTADVPNFFRKPWGNGWALVGDAGYVKDPVTGTGIADAFRDSVLLVRGLDEALSGTLPAEESLAAYQRRRDRVALPAYEFTLKLAAGDPSAFAEASS